MGVREKAEMLDDMTSENYGDAYLIGAEPPYDVYIWTRPDAFAGQFTAYWLNIGKLAIEGGPGPAGRSISSVALNVDGRLLFTFSDGGTLLLAEKVKGDKGDSGKDGKTPRITATAETGGVRITTYDGDGNTVSSAFVSNGKDAKGEPGKDGANAYLNFIGTFANIGMADATQYNVGDIAIENLGSVTDIYICVGVPGYPAQNAWQQIAFGGGTQVFQNDVMMNVWDADTKLDKVETPAKQGMFTLYGVNSNGTQVMVDAGAAAVPNSVVLTNYNNRITTFNPVSNYDCATKYYVD